MAAWHWPWQARGTRVPPLVWRPVDPSQPVHLAAPAYRGRRAVITQVASVADEPGSRAVTDGTTQTVAAGSEVEHVVVMGTRADDGHELPVAALLAVRLSRALAPWGVANEITQPLTTRTTAGRVEVPLPVDEDPYDGRAWRVHCTDVRLAHVLFDQQMWAALELLDRHPMVLWCDGDRLVLQTHPGDMAARALAAVARLLEDRLASGELDPWLIEPLQAPVLTGRAARFAATGWQVDRVPRELLWEIWDQGAIADLGFRARREVAGVEVSAIEFVAPLEDHRFGVGRLGFAHGLVMVPLPHPVTEQVYYAPAHAWSRRDVATEWGDFDEAVAVQSTDERTGHEVTTPRLMQFLVDHELRRLQVKGPWILAGIAPFEPDEAERVARLLVEVRELLPGYQVRPRH